MVLDKHKAVYGSVCMERAYCTDCETTAFIIDQKLQCCGKIVIDDISTDKVQFMSESRKTREYISPGVKKCIIELQDNKCFYCGKTFGSCYRKVGASRVSQTRAVFDHILPFANGGSNRHNIVAACNICNGKKSAKMFNNLYEAILYLRDYVRSRFIFSN